MTKKIAYCLSLVLYFFNAHYPCTATAKDFQVVAIASKADWVAKVEKSTKLTIVKFFAPWCSHCVKMAPIFQALAEKYGNQCNFYEVNSDASQDLVQEHSIESFPTFKMFDVTGKKIGEIDGSTSQEKFETVLESLLKGFTHSEKNGAPGCTAVRRSFVRVSSLETGVAVSVAVICGYLGYRYINEKNKKDKKPAPAFGAVTGALSGFMLASIISYMLSGKA